MQSPRPETYRVGSVQVSCVRECSLTGFSPTSLLPEWQSDFRSAVPDDVWSAMTAPDGEHLVLSVHTWVARDRGTTILIDTGAGNDKPRPHTPYFDHLQNRYLERLAEIDVAPDDVDYVLLTHLHVDHVGWNTRLVDGRWKPTFPNARYVFSREDHRFFTDPANHNERNRTSFQVQSDSVDPIIEAGLAEMIDVNGQDVVSGFSFHPTPGHTANHASIVLRNEGEHAIFSGDVAHTPLQVFYPELNSTFDAERERTSASRRWALDYTSENDALFFSSHFPSTSAGRVGRVGGRFAWSFE